MSNNMKVFTKCSYDGTAALQVLGDKNNPWFICKEVFDFLGIPKNYMARKLKTLDEDEKMVAEISKNKDSSVITLMTERVKRVQGSRNTIYLISEPGFYKIALTSQTERAKEFTRWVTHEVLPRIRKYGYYKLTVAEEKANAINSIMETLGVTALEKKYYKMTLPELKNESETLKTKKAFEEEFLKMKEKYPYTIGDINGAVHYYKWLQTLMTYHDMTKNPKYCYTCADGTVLFSELFRERIVKYVSDPYYEWEE